MGRWVRVILLFCLVGWRIASADLLMDYRMDGCGWSGDSGEVKDSSGNGYDGTAENGATTMEDSDGVLCKVTELQGKYISLEDEPTLGDSWTMSLWIRFPLEPTDDQFSGNGKDYFIVGSVDGTGDLGYFTKETDGDNYTWGVYDNDGNADELSLGSIEDGWHHIVEVVKDGETTLYFDKQEIGSVSLYTTGDVKYVGTSTDDEDGQTIGARIDEFKLFDTNLSSDDVADIYDNESGGKNYDGSPRYCTLCPVSPGCATGSGLNMWTYDISSSSDHFPDDLDEFDEMEKNYGTLDYLFGAGLVNDIDASGGDNNPYHEGADNRYMSIFEGYLYVPGEGTYTFAVNGDDAVDLVLNDGEDSYGWYGGHGMDGTDHNREFNFGKAGYYRLKFRHQDWDGGDGYQLYWKRPGDSDFSIIPKTYFRRCHPPTPRVVYRMEGCDTGDENWLLDTVGEDENATYRNDDGIVSLVRDGKIFRGTDIAGAEDDHSKINAFIAGVAPADLGDRGSVSFWFASHTPWDNGEGRVLVDATDGDTEKYFLLGLTEDGYLEYWLEDSNDGDFHAKSSSPRDYGADEWVHIVFTWDFPGKSFKLYVNGEKVAMTISKDEAGGDSDDHAPDALPLHFGDVSTDGYEGVYSSTETENSANGRFDEAWLYTQALTADDIKTIYAYGKGKSAFNGYPRYPVLCPATVECGLGNGVRLSTYDIEDSSVSQPADHAQYDQMENDFATDDYLFGSGIVDTIDTSETSDNNPYHDDPDDKYLAIFTGYVYIPEGGIYRFAINGDDAVEVVFGDAEDYYGWYGAHASDGTEHNRHFYFAKEGYYKLKFRMQDWTGDDSYQLYWVRDDEFEIVPTDNLFYCADSGASAYRFDAWDPWRGIDDRNISTRVVHEGFDLSVASLTEEGDDFQDFNGTVCVRVVESDATDTALTDWYKIAFDEENLTTLSGIDVARARKNLRVQIAWKQGADEDCPLSDEDNSTLSTDGFAVRPDRFTVNVSGSNKAGESLTLDFGALDGSGAAALDYNETEGGSFEVRYRETDADCITGVFDPPIDDGWQFTDGNRSIDTRYSEVGSVELNVSEAVTCEDRFAAVDCDDGDVDGTWSKEENLSITPAGLTLRFYPHHFDLNATLYSFDNGPFTYLSKDLNMSAYVVFDIVAKNGQNERTANYIDVCYAKDINLSLTHADVDADALGKLGYMISDADEVNGSVNWDYGKNETVKWQMPASSFSTANSRVDTNGTTAFVFYFNFDRNASLPVSPFDLNLTDAGVDDGDAQSDGYETLEGNTTFYYGRLRADDLTTTLDDAPHRYRIEIYSKTALNLRRMSLYWYLNAAHDSGSQGHVSATRVTDGVRLTDTEDGDVTLDGILDDPTDGVNDFVISDSTPKRRVVHMAVPSWLWFVPDGFGGSYLYDTGDSNSDCTRHPCFIYTRLRGAGSRRGVLSGGYEGSDFNVTESPKTRSGVKLFR